MSNLYEQWDKLKLAEKIYIMKYPHHAFIIKESREIAFEQTKKLFGSNRRNDRSDAFRHCFWSAILARDIGYENARKFTTDHETFPNNPKKEKEMDLHNNTVGLKIGRFSKATNQVLSTMCLSALNQGKLKFINP